MNKFGGNWTEEKIEILVKYAKAYLTIMNKYAKKNNWNLLYFDGFAGSGYITKENQAGKKIIVGAAKRILEISTPCSFDMYYFVEKDTSTATMLTKNTKDVYPNKKIHIVDDDCNRKIKDLSQFLKSHSGRSYKVLAYIDPYGMQLNWNSLVTLERSNVDVWILIPTGLGVNRLLKKNGEISDEWIKRLEMFLGIPKDEILSYFYKKETVQTLFGKENKLNKVEDAINKSSVLYSDELNNLFKFVSKPYALKNASNSTMFHFIMASNNKIAVKIANEIIQRYMTNK